MTYTLKCIHAGDTYAFHVLLENTLIGGITIPRDAVNNFIHNVWNGGIDWCGHIAP